MCDACTIRCSCGCGNGLFVDFKFTEVDGNVYVETVVPGFYAYQGGFILRLLRRIKAAWYMLIGKEYTLHEIVLDKEHWTYFVGAINEMDIEYCLKNT